MVPVDDDSRTSSGLHLAPLLCLALLILADILHTASAASGEAQLCAPEKGDRDRVLYLDSSLASCDLFYTVRWRAAAGGDPCAASPTMVLWHLGGETPLQLTAAPDYIADQVGRSALACPHESFPCVRARDRLPLLTAIRHAFDGTGYCADGADRAGAIFGGASPAPKLVWFKHPDGTGRGLVSGAAFPFHQDPVLPDNVLDQALDWLLALSAAGTPNQGLAVGERGWATLDANSRLHVHLTGPWARHQADIVGSRPSTVPATTTVPLASLRGGEQAARNHQLLDPGLVLNTDAHDREGLLQLLVRPRPGDDMGERMLQDPLIWNLKQ